MPDELLIFQGPAVANGENVRAAGWFNEDGSATVVVESTENADSDATLEIPATSVGLDLRIALGHTSKVSQRDKPPASVFNRARRAKRSGES